MIENILPSNIANYTKHLAITSILSTSGFLSALNPSIDNIVSSTKSSSQVFDINQGKPVGALQEKWQFPSDHLPIGVTVDDVNITSWNVLNTVYLDWILEKDTLGIARSMIAEENIPVNECGLTVRDQHIISQILSMIQSPNSPQDILALQECGQPFLEQLAADLPDNMQIIYSSPLTTVDQNVLIINTNQFTYLKNESKIEKAFVNSEPERILMNIALQKGEKKYRIINAHVPGSPDLPGRQDFADYVTNQASDDFVTIGLGDTNFQESELDEAFNQAAKNHGIPNQFVRISPYPTNIHPYAHFSKAIDHFLISNNAKIIEARSANQVLPELQSLVNLLS